MTHGSIGEEYVKGNHHQMITAHVKRIPNILLIVITKIFEVKCISGTFLWTGTKIYFFKHQLNKIVLSLIYLQDNISKSIFLKSSKMYYLHILLHITDVCLPCVLLWQRSRELRSHIRHNYTYWINKGKLFLYTLILIIFLWWFYLFTWCVELFTWLALLYTWWV